MKIQVPNTIVERNGADAEKRMKADENIHGLARAGSLRRGPIKGATWTAKAFQLTDLAEWAIVNLDLTITALSQTSRARCKAQPALIGRAAISKQTNAGIGLSRCLTWKSRLPNDWWTRALKACASSGAVNPPGRKSAGGLIDTGLLANWHYLTRMNGENRQMTLPLSKAKSELITEAIPEAEEQRWMRLKELVESQETIKTINPNFGGKNGRRENRRRSKG